MSTPPLPKGTPCTPQLLRGFRDFLPKDKKQRDWLTAKIKETFERFGFEPIETPALEYSSLLLGKYGTEADKLVYRFTDNGGRDVALRFDQTVPTARVLALNQNPDVLPQLLRRYQIQNVFRADKPQKGRYREFIQCDADIFASTPPIADAEILSVYAEIYRNVGFQKLIIKVNDRETLLPLLLQAGILENQLFSVIQSIDKLEKIQEDGVSEELLKKGLSLPTIKRVFENLRSAKPSKNLSAIVLVAEELGIPKDTIRFSTTLARGLDYYTGMVFEGIIPNIQGGSVGGGGRYDKLIESLGGVAIKAVGFGLGFDRTLEAAEELGLLPRSRATATVLVTIFEGNPVQSVKTARFLRDQGINTELFTQPVKLDKQLKYADKKGIPYVVILGPEEAENGTATVKDMRKQSQQTVPLAKLPNLLRE